MVKYINLESIDKDFADQLFRKYPSSYSPGILAAIKEIKRLPAVDVAPAADIDIKLSLFCPHELINQLRFPCPHENCVLCQRAADVIEMLSEEILKLKMLTCGCCDPQKGKERK